jgi:hypothetical protein
MNSARAAGDQSNFSIELSHATPLYVVDLSGDSLDPRGMTTSNPWVLMSILLPFRPSLACLCERGSRQLSLEA